MNRVLFLSITICLISIIGYSQNRLQNFSLSKPVNNALHSFSITKSKAPSFLKQQQGLSKTASKMPIIKPKGYFSIPNFFNESKTKKHLLIYTPE